MPFFTKWVCIKEFCFILFCLESTYLDVQGLLLILKSGIIPYRLGILYGCQRQDPSRQQAWQTQYLLYYNSGPCVRNFSH